MDFHSRSLADEPDNVQKNIKINGNAHQMQKKKISVIFTEEGYVLLNDHHTPDPPAQHTLLDKIWYTLHEEQHTFHVGNNLLMLIATPLAR